VSYYDILLDVVIEINLFYQDRDDSLDPFPRVKHIKVVYHLRLKLGLCHNFTVRYVSKSTLLLCPFVNHFWRDPYADGNKSVVSFIRFALRRTLETTTLNR
jgi:hypothetical protein